MVQQLSRVLAITFLVSLGVGPVFAQLPEDFYDTKILDGFELPTGITFDQDGRGYIWEIEGLVHILDTNGQVLPEPLIDIREEVSNWNDHGLNYVCLDKDFTNNGLIYLFYVVDMHHYEHFGTPTYHPDTTVRNAASFGRIVRYEVDQANDGLSVLPDSRHIVFGREPSEGIPILMAFHGLGSMLHASDGTLLISCGDASNNLDYITGGNPDDPFIQDAIASGIITPDQDIGAYRSQYLGSFNGKILRLDAETGEGLPSNPYYDADAPRSAQSLTWAMGLRNPYRIILQPGTGSHFSGDGNPGNIMIGDVGNGGWEELNLATYGGQNFGWPVHEGYNLAWNFWVIDVPDNPMAPNPIPNCGTGYFNFMELLARPSANGPWVRENPCDGSQPIPAEVYPQYAKEPVISWNNSKWNPPRRTRLPAWNENDDLAELYLGLPDTEVEGDKFDGFSSLAGLFYGGDLFPEEYRGKYFSLDFSGWIKVFDFDDEMQLTSVHSFHDFAKDIIHLAQNPVDGALYYTNVTGEVHKVTYGGNPPPVAIIEVDEQYGVSPLTVALNASSSFDPNDNDLAYSWDFGDGESEEGLTVDHVFTSSGSGPDSYRVILTVTDSEGAQSTDEKIISLNNTPPQVEITSFKDGDRYPLNGTSLLVLAADVTDAEHSDEELLYTWRVFLHHNEHFHPEPVDYERRTHTLISPLGCYNEDYYYRIELTVTDPEGLATSVTQQVYPYCDDDFVDWVDLKATPMENGVQLDWSTIFEEGIVSMELQRSPNFFDFETIAQIDPTGNSSSRTDYQFFDAEPIRGSQVYRVKVITDQRAYAYSNLVVTSFPPPKDWSVFPNPALSSFTIEVKEALSDQVKLELFNAQGQRLRITSFPANVGEEWSQPVLTNLLPAGVYWYRIYNGELVYTGQLVVQ